MENFAKKREELVNKWNTKVLCKKPSEKRIRKYKKQLQNKRRITRELLKDNDVYIEAAMKQDEEIRKFRSEQNGSGNTPENEGVI